MPKRAILLLDSKESAWTEFLREFLEDTASVLTHVADAARVSTALDELKPDVIFANPAGLTLALTQKLKALMIARPEVLLFRTGPAEKSAEGILWQTGFDQPPPMSEFQRQMVQNLPLPDRLRVLVVDDEAEVARAVTEYFENRSMPAFEITFADNGRKGLEMLKRSRPDVLVLDIKMPVKDGREVYREIRQQPDPVPVIIFFDAVSGEELMEIRRLGHPAVVEKGSRESGMPEMMALIKKLAYFG